MLLISEFKELKDNVLFSFNIWEELEGSFAFLAFVIYHPVKFSKV